MNQSIELQVFDDSDRQYADVVDIHNQILTDAITNVEETRRWDEVLASAKRPAYRILAYNDKQAIGYGWAFLEPTPQHPIRFGMTVNVLETYRKRGLGTALYNQLIEKIAPHQPTQYAIITRESRQDGVRFVESRGYERTITSYKQRLDVESVDLTLYEDQLNRLSDQNIQLTTYHLLNDDPYRDRKLYELMIAVEHDIPVDGMPEPMSFEMWQEENNPYSPYFLAEGLMVAVHENEYVGVCQLFKPAQAGRLHNGITGVRADYRGRGIALAVKLASIRYAQEQGIREITTYNESQNRPILALNEKLGFRRLPAEYTYVKNLR